MYYKQNEYYISNNYYYFIVIFSNRKGIYFYRKSLIGITVKMFLIICGIKNSYFLLLVATVNVVLLVRVKNA